MIYLDNNATTPVDPEVSDAVFSSLKRTFGNPSSAHLSGVKAREEIDNSRLVVARFLGCSQEEIYFTSGGTESNNLALLGTSMAHKKGHIITSAIEHPSVLNTCRHLESIGFDVSYIAVDADGIIKLDEFREALRKDTFLISIMHANNETGVIQPIDEVGGIIKSRGIAFHVDAAQSIGKIKYTLDNNAVNMMTIVPHKFYGPKGIGALYIKKGARIKPILYGANHEMGMRPGTENVAGIVGLAKACEIARRDMELRISHTLALRNTIWNKLVLACPGITLNGHPEKRLPNTLNISVPGLAAYELVEKLRESVAVSTGSACHAGKQRPSPALKSMGRSDEEALSSIRLSVGKDNTEQEIEEAVGIIASAIKELNKK